MLVNSFLVRWSETWTEVADPTSIAANGRFEAALGLGAIHSHDSVVAVASSQLDTYANPREQITLSAAPATPVDDAYLGYETGDIITVPDSTLAPVPERVAGLTVTIEAATGRAVLTPTLKDVILDAGDRNAQALKKMVNGTLQGSSNVATPLAEVLPRTSPNIKTESNIPFIVVADDNSGDFVSIKSAIDAIAAGVYTVIFVKQSVDGGYVDTGQIDITGKQFTISSVVGSMAPAVPLFLTLATLPTWRMDGFTATSGTAQVAISGMEVLERTGTVVLFAGTGTINVAIADSYIRLFAGLIESAVGIRHIHIRDSDLSGRLVRDNATMSSTHEIRIDSCHEEQLLDGTVTWTSGTRFEFMNNTVFNDAGGSGDIHTFLGDTSFTDNMWRGTAGNRIGITWAPTATDKAFRFTGNIAGQGGSSVESDLVVDYGNASPAATVLVAANTMREMNLTVDGPAVPSRQDTYISGAYHTLILNASNARADVALNLATDTGLTALTVGGNANLVVAALNGGTGATSTTYSVTGDDNVFVLSGEATFTAGGTDSGTNNQRASLVAL